MSEPFEQCDWEQQLQDRIDGDLDPVQSSALDAHLTSCATCRARISALQSLDEALSESLPPQALGAPFDRRVLERVASEASADRAAARARLEREWRAQMADLSRQWRRAWKALALNVLAGLAVLIALAATFDLLPFVSALIDRAGSLTQQLSVRPAGILLTAVGLTAAALWLVRTLGNGRR